MAPISLFDMSSNKFEALGISDDSDDDVNIGESGKIAGKSSFLS